MFKEQFLSRKQVIPREKGRVEWEGRQRERGREYEQTGGSGVRISV